MAAPGARVTIVGGGLAGALTAITLGRAGHRVEIYERRGDPRRGDSGEGRSINLAIAARGIHALSRAGLAEEILSRAVPMRGRMLHGPDGKIRFQAYGIQDQEVIHSVSRAYLNRALLEAAERTENVRVHYERRCLDLDPETAVVRFASGSGDGLEEVASDFVVGADGAFSAVRTRLVRREGFDYEQSYLPYGYKELTFPSDPGGRHPMEPEALHIWPRGGQMLIALPNPDGSFTGTCFFPMEGPGSFAALRTPAEVTRYFREVYPDAAAAMPGLAEEFFRNPTGSLVTIRCAPWHHGSRVVLVGDACHAVVPFYGEGANASFEDCEVLESAMIAHGGERERAFAVYFALRKPHTDALADLSLANFVEMRDHTASPAFLAGKRLERALYRLFPSRYIPLYSMVKFCRIPYADAVARARRQNVAVASGGAALLLLAALFLTWVF
jgi:kynurenine 3-monooxygenase